MTRPRFLTGDGPRSRYRGGAPVRPRKPADTPFGHEDRCQTRDAEPQWEDVGDGNWTRTCSCTVEYMHSVEPVPAVPLDVTAHRHGEQEPGVPCPAVAVLKVDDGLRSTYCAVCGTRVTYMDVRGYRPEDLAGLVH